MADEHGLGTFYTTHICGLVIALEGELVLPFRRVGQNGTSNSLYLCRNRPKCPNANFFRLHYFC